MPIKSINLRLLFQKLIEKTRAQAKKMRTGFTRSSKMSNVMLHRVQMLEGRVENMERYYRKLNHTFKGFPKNRSYSDPALREGKARLKALLEKGKDRQIVCCALHVVKRIPTNASHALKDLAVIAYITGLKLSAVQISAVLDSTVNIHWMDAHHQNRNEGKGFIVRFDRQDSVELINKSLPKLKDYCVRLSSGQENYFLIDPDLGSSSATNKES